MQSRNMSFVDKYVVFLMSLVVSNYGEYVTEPGFGYLLLNASKTPYCHDLQENEICPSNVVNYQILELKDNVPAISTYELQAVKIALDALHFFEVTQECRDSVRTYYCSNTFPICLPDAKYGVNLRYDYNKTMAACEKIKQICPINITRFFTFGCSFVQKDVTGYDYCTKPPQMDPEICPRSKYTVSKIISLS